MADFQTKRISDYPITDSPDSADLIPSIHIDGPDKYNRNITYAQLTLDAKGEKGDKGDRGEQGVQGTPGLDGSVGPKGDTGAQGPQGPKGDQGLTGPVGATGQQGPQGLKGDKGETGDKGLQGNQGIQGPQGEVGPKGDTGPQGPKGDQGDPATNLVKSVNGRQGDIVVNKNDVGLGSVDNTSDTNKPVSTAQQTALNAKVNKSGDTITGPIAMQSFYGGDDDGSSGNTDGVSRIVQQSYQRAGTNNWGEVHRIELRKSDAKAMTAYYFPNSYDTNGDPVGNLYPKVWFGAHADSTGHTGYHNHWSIEVPDSKQLLRTRFGINFAPSGADDPTSVGTGLDKTTILTNNADMVVSTHYDTYQAGDTTVPTGPKGQASLRLKGNAGIPQDIEFGRSIYNDSRRWVMRNSGDAESGSNAGANFQLLSYDDTGTLLGTALNVDRATGLTTIGLTSSYRNGGLVINKSNTGNALRINNTFAGGTLWLASAQDTASRIISAQTTNDTIQRFVLFADGKMEFGAGGSTSRDTNLYRSAADTLMTDDRFIAAGQVQGSALVPTGSSVPTNGINLAATNTLGFSTNGSGRMQINATGIIYVNNTTAAPTVSPGGGGQLYVEGGALKFRGSGGTVTTIAGA